MNIINIVGDWFAISYAFGLSIGGFGYIIVFCKDDDIPFYKKIWCLPFLGTVFYDKFNLIGTLIVSILFFVVYFPATLTLSIISLIGCFILKLFTLGK